MTESTCAASSTLSAKMETQSSVRHAGTTPLAPTRPGVGLRPTTWLNAAGTRPDPAVSVPNENATRADATGTADPELEPPLMWSALKTLAGWPYGERVPTRPLANWSRVVLPIHTAPPPTRRPTAPAGAAARPAMWLLSLTGSGPP